MLRHNSCAAILQDLVNADAGRAPVEQRIPVITYFSSFWEQKSTCLLKTQSAFYNASVHEAH